MTVQVGRGDGRCFRLWDIEFRIGAPSLVGIGGLCLYPASASAFESLVIALAGPGNVAGGRIGAHAPTLAARTAARGRCRRCAGPGQRLVLNLVPFTLTDRRAAASVRTAGALRSSSEHGRIGCVDRATAACSGESGRDGSLAPPRPGLFSVLRAVRTSAGRAHRSHHRTARQLPRSELRLPVALRPGLLAVARSSLRERRDVDLAVRGPSNSQKKTPWYVPRARPRPAAGSAPAGSTRARHARATGRSGRPASSCVHSQSSPTTRWNAFSRSVTSSGSMRSLIATPAVVCGT